MPKVTEEYLDSRLNFILDCAAKVIREKPLYQMTMRDIIKNLVTSFVTNNINEIATYNDTNKDTSIVNNRGTKSVTYDNTIYVTNNVSNSVTDKLTVNNTKKVNKNITKKVTIFKTISIGKRG